jgi:phosphoribosylformylglycinamidine synthase subunit PurQ / glutaminase
MTPRVNVLYFPGTNCDDETMRAFRSVGAAPNMVYLRDLLTGEERLDSADIVCIPGGFAFGDHLGAGSVAAVALRTALYDQLQRCRERLMLCICNGFQIALRAGCFADGVTLGVNDSGTFHDKPDQVHVVAEDADSPWLTGLQGKELVFPCAHGEGRFVHSGPGQWRCALRYPPEANPDGSMDNIAGITDSTGRVLGLMDHPERAIHRSDNLAIFANGVDAAR